MGSIVNKTTGKYNGYRISEPIVDENFDSENLVWIPQNYTESYIKPIWNFETNVFFDNATEEEIQQYKRETVLELKAECRKKLLPTDWYVIRKLERNVDIPGQITEERNRILMDYDNQISKLL